MPVPVKPTEDPRWATDVSAELTEPPAGKKDTGWIAEQPPFQYENWLKNTYYKWKVWLDTISDYFSFGDDATKAITILGPANFDEDVTMDKDLNITGDLTVGGNLQTANLFRTNFSVPHVKEDTEDTQGQNQYSFGEIPFDGKYSTIDQTLCRANHVDTVLIPPVSPEMTLTGSWGNVDSANYKFYRAKQSSTAGDSLYFNFTGVSCGYAGLIGADANSILAELQSADGLTTLKKKRITKGSGTGVSNEIFYLFSGLEFGDYRLKITLDRAINFEFMYGFYTTRMSTQVSAYQYYHQGAVGKTLADVPLNTMLLTGTWGVKNGVASSTWNSRYHSTATVSDTVEIRSYGNKFYLIHLWENINITLSVTVDGGTAGVKNTTITPALGGPGTVIPTMIRLDDGTLSDGLHDWKIEVTVSTSGSWDFCGFASHSDTNDNTLCRSAIMGKDSVKIGVDDSGFTFNGAGWGAIVDSSASYLRRKKQSVGNAGDYLEYTIPNNTKAIYMVSRSDTTTSNSVTATVGGANGKTVSSLATTTQQADVLFLLYAEPDGVSLGTGSTVLRITNDTTSAFDIEGLLFEIGDAFQEDNIRVHQKTTRFQSSAGDGRSPISMSHYLEVDGVVERKPKRTPIVDSGWCYSSSSLWARDGLGLELREYLTTAGYANSGAIAKNWDTFAFGGTSIESNGSGAVAGTGPHLKQWQYTNQYTKLSIIPCRVVG
jgi:hypothetical protein